MSKMLNMTFKHKLPIPMDIKAQFPITEEMQAPPNKFWYPLVAGDCFCPAMQQRKCRPSCNR